MSMEQDAFARTAGALSATFRAHADLLDSAPAQFCNLLLDACGSDHRPLVDLLLATGTQLRPQLIAHNAHVPWDARRAPLVHQLVATRYLQTDVARWLVDTWGAVLEVAPQQVTRPSIVHAETSPLVTSAGFVRAVGMVPLAVARPAPTQIGAPTPLRPPSAASGQSAGRTGATVALAGNAAKAKVHPATARAVIARRRALSPAMTAKSLAQMQRIERTALATMGIAAVVMFIAAFVALRGRRVENILAASVLPVVEPGSSADSVRIAALGAMRALPPAESAAGVRSVVVGGVSASHSVALPPTPSDGAQLISRGLGGRYRVTQRSVSVTGSPSCVTVADALARAPSTIEVVSHAPGTFLFALASRSVNGRLDADAYFEAGPQRGTTDGVTWTFRMRGRFTSSGFTAETSTNTEAILRWGRTQVCTTVAQLDAERIPE